MPIDGWQSPPMCKRDNVILLDVGPVTQPSGRVKVIGWCPVGLHDVYEQHFAYEWTDWPILPCHQCGHQTAHERVLPFSFKCGVCGLTKDPTEAVDG